MYWDIAWHIDLGRDKNLFTIPHTLIVSGIGICVFGAWLSMVLPGPASPGAMRIGRYTLPVGGLVLLVCGSVALLAFPLDDLWHRLFGEDVTLWGPTHILMIGGASLCALGIIVLSSEAPAQGAADEQRRKSWPLRIRQLPRRRRPAGRALDAAGRVRLRRAAVPDALPAGDDRDRGRHRAGVRADHARSLRCDRRRARLLRDPRRPGADRRRRHGPHAAALPALHRQCARDRVDRARPLAQPARLRSGLRACGGNLRTCN